MKQEVHFYLFPDVTALFITKKPIYLNRQVSFTFVWYALQSSNTSVLP